MPIMRKMNLINVHFWTYLENPTNKLLASAPQVFVPNVVQVNIPLPPPLDKGNLSVAWKKFKRAWDNYNIASRLRNETKELRQLHC